MTDILETPDFTSLALHRIVDPAGGVNFIVGDTRTYQPYGMFDARLIASPDVRTVVVGRSIPVGSKAAYEGQGQNVITREDKDFVVHAAYQWFAVDEAAALDDTALGGALLSGIEQLAVDIIAENPDLEFRVLAVGSVTQVTEGPLKGNYVVGDVRLS